MSGEQIKLTQFYDGTVTKPANLSKKKEKKDIKEKLEKALTGVTDYSKADFSKINVANISVDDLENLMEDVIKDKYKKSDKTEYKTALKEMEQQINALEKQRKDIAQTKVRVAAECAYNTNSNIEGNNDMRKAVKDNLKTQYQEGKISKEVYEKAKGYGETSKIGHIVKSAVRGIIGKRSDAYQHYESVINNNNVNVIKNNGKELQLEAEQKAKLDTAGISKGQIYEIGDNFVGGEAEVTYSCNKKLPVINNNPQPGEKHFITTKLNALAKDAGKDVTFTDEDSAKIMEAAGYKIEKSVNVGETIRGAVLGTALFGGGAVMGQEQVVSFDGKPAIINQQSLWYLFPTVGATLGGLNSVKEQVTRVEEKVMGMQLPDNIKTYNDFADYVEKSTEIRKENKELINKVGNFYQDEDGNFLKDQFIKDGQRMAGHSDKGTPDASKLNHKELLAWLGQLEAGKVIIEIPQKQVTCEVTVKEHVKDVKVDDTHCQKVKSWHRWWMYANQYNPKNSDERNEIIRYLKTEELKALQEKGLLLDKKPTDNFFPTVGTKLCLPDKIPGKGGKTYQFDDTVVLKKPDKPEESVVDPSKPQTTCASYSKQEADHRGTTQEKTLSATDCDGTVLVAGVKNMEEITKGIDENGDPDIEYIIHKK